MQAIKNVRSRSVVLPTRDIDTDQIIAARFLTTTTREGLGQSLFYDLRFAAEMASKGLWREALFRWRKVLRHRPDDPRLLNNVAVAFEATGEFEAAREHYERALALADAEDEIAGNFSLFVSAQELLAREDEESAGPEASSGSGDE